jgi:hypothetical protein
MATDNNISEYRNNQNPEAVKLVQAQRLKNIYSFLSIVFWLSSIVFAYYQNTVMMN